MFKILQIIFLTVILNFRCKCENEGKLMFSHTPYENFSRQDFEPNLLSRRSMSDTRGRILSGGPNQLQQHPHYVQARTALGTVIGTVEQIEVYPQNPSSRPGGTFYAFRGIPYAKPPIGNLRWADPEPLTEPWERGRLDATKYRSFCPQYDHDKNIVVGNEDCLYLNIFTPILPGNDHSIKLPVLVFIHGGAYTRGASSSHGPERLMREDIIVVTLNYRLGVLGLLSMNNEEFPGNYAALDQVEALKWVRRHIADFGGDFDAVTLGGFSAGASYVHLHTLSPLSQGLFHRAILMSGAGNCIWSIQEWPWYVARQLAQDLNCPTSSNYDLRQCLQLQDTETLLKAQAKRSRYVYWPFEYRPVIDEGLRANPFLPAPVEELLKRSETSSIPILMGGTPEEGILFALTVLLFSEESSNPKFVYDKAANYIFESLWANYTTDTHMSEVFKSFYFSENSKTNLNTLVTEMTDAMTDLFFTSCIWDAAANFASLQAPVYTYLMTHHDEQSPSFAAPLYRLAIAAGITSPLLSHGVSHGDDVVLVFNFPNTLGTMTNRDFQMSLLLTSAIGSFVKTGNPQAEILSQYGPWVPIKPGEPVYYYRLSLSPILIQKQFRHKERNFWQQTLRFVEETYERSRQGWHWQIAFWVIFSVLLVLLLIAIIIAVIVHRSRHTRQYGPGAALRSQRPRPTSMNLES